MNATVTVEADLLQGANRALGQAVTAVQHLREIQDLLNWQAPFTAGTIKARVAQLIVLATEAANRPKPSALCASHETLCRRCLNDPALCDKAWQRAEEPA